MISSIYVQCDDQICAPRTVLNLSNWLSKLIDNSGPHRFLIAFAAANSTVTLQELINDENYLPQLVGANGRQNPPALLERSWSATRWCPSPSVTNGGIHLLGSGAMIGGMIHIPPALRSAGGRIYALPVSGGRPVTTSDILRSISQFSVICAWHRWSSPLRASRLRTAIDPRAEVRIAPYSFSEWTHF